MRSVGVLTLLITAFLGGMGCSKKPVTPGLVSTSAMGTLRGFHFIRAITHFHSPFSFDACDGKGFSESDASIKMDCLNDARYALCENHIDLTFVTDHPSHMAEVDYSRLLLNQSGDTLIQNGAAQDVATRIHCADGFAPVMAPGLEGKFLALGMESHVAGTVAARTAIYDADTGATKTALENAAGPNAIVVIPHTESRDTATLIALAPSVIEIYNLHANLDPRIRKTYLGKAPFAKIGKFLNYLLDPYSSLYADYLFTDFFETSDVYFQKWNAMTAAGLHVTGVGGLDSHENIFSQSASDGQRLDHHRRMTRFMNNIVMTTADDLPTVKAAITAGRVFMAIEGLGIPIGFDFHGTVGATVTEMGDTMTLAPPQASSISVHLPRVYERFPGMEDSITGPEIWADLHHIDAAGNDTIVASAGGSDLVYSTPATGHYRVHVLMRPYHLSDYLFNPENAGTTYTWIVSNLIKVQ